MTPIEHSLTAIQAELDRYTFMPGWTLTATDNHTDPFGWPMLVIKAMVEDAEHPGVRQELSRVASIPPNIETDPRYFSQWLRGVLIGAWIHEVDEWLRRDGVYVQDPHPELRDQPQEA